MLHLFLKGKNGQYDAEATYDIAAKEFIILKGSKVSATVSDAEKFRSAESVKRMREANVKGGKVIKDVWFKSASTAANFVTGTSTNGMIAWKDRDGKKLKEIL